MTPRSARRLRVSMATAGVGIGPTRITSMPIGDEARGQRRLDHVARQPRVLADDDAVAMIAAPELAPGGHGQAQRDLGGHRLGIGRAPDAVGAEQLARHCRLMAWAPVSDRGRGVIPNT